MWTDDDYDGVQYDDFYAPDPHQLEADAIRRQCYGLDVSGAVGADGMVYSDADPGL